MVIPEGYPVTLSHHRETVVSDFIGVMNSRLDVWEGSELAYDFNNIQYLHYFLRLGYKRKRNVFVFNFFLFLTFCICVNLKRGEDCNFQKTDFLSSVS